MRVISGKARGLKLLAPEGDKTRPTTDRVKESVFNILQPFIPCDRVLDLFAGSGAMGIEALSRGSNHCVFVEKNRNSLDIIYKNLEKSRLSLSSEVVCFDALMFLDSRPLGFDLIFLDPPYGKGFLSPVFDKIFKNALLRQGGIIVVESETGGETVSDSRFECFKSAKYGKTVVSLFRQNGVD